MKKYILLLLIGIFLSCDNHNSDNQDDETSTNYPESKEKQLINRYKNTIIPLFKHIPNIDFPTNIIINQEELNIDAGAAAGYLEVSKGLLNEEETIQLFALAHEVAHMATLPQASLFELSGAIPEGDTTNYYKKAEYLADLIAIHLIHSKLPEKFNSLQSKFTYLKKVLREETFTHPSGEDRIRSMKVYLENSNNSNEKISFKNRFISIWNMK